MPAMSHDTEADAVEAAFGQRVQVLYQTLGTNLVVSPNAERTAIEAFRKGLEIARRTRELALRAIEETPAASAATARMAARNAVPPRKAARARKSRA